jgi:hypothetical protein
MSCQSTEVVFERMPYMSPPHESFKGSVEDWRNLTAHQRFDINNPGCKKDRENKRYAKNKDILKERRDEPINKERKAKWQKQYGIDNRERLNKVHQEWRGTRTETYSAQQKKWRDDNPDKCRAARLRCDLKKQKNFDVMFHDIL